MSWKISKQIDFCYSHRVHNQSLNKEYSIDNRCLCRHVHGHQGAIIINLTSKKLLGGMVTDFKHLNWFKKFVDDVLDHKFIIDKNDPLFNIIVPPYFITGIPDEPQRPPIKSFDEDYSIINPNWFKTFSNEHMIELYESFVIVDFVPTSENISKWLYEIVEEKMNKIGVEVESVEFCETPKTSSIYEK